MVPVDHLEVIHNGRAIATVPTATAFADEPSPRTVSVSGQGEVSAEPDLAYVTLGVQARRPTMAEARKEVATTVERVLALCKELKIDPKFVNATRVQVQPDYSWDERNRKQVLLGYIVSKLLGGCGMQTVGKGMSNHLAHIAFFKFRQWGLGFQCNENAFDLPTGVRVKNRTFNGQEDSQP